MSIEHGSPEIVTGNSGSDINFQEQLQRIHAYEAEKHLEEEGIDYQKIDRFVLQLTSPGEDEQNDSSISIDDFNIEEIKYLMDLNINLDSPELRNSYIKEDISNIFTRLIKAKENPRFYTFFDYDKNEGREVQNLKTSEAISDTICFQDLTPEEIQKMTETAIKDFFQGPALQDSEAEFSFISRLLSYPPVKQYAEPVIMNYWFMWSHQLVDRCDKADFTQIGEEELKSIKQLLTIAQNSYTFLEAQGLEPNEYYADFILDFIRRCSEAENYYLNVSAEAATQQIIGTDFEKPTNRNSDLDMISRSNLIDRAFQILDPYFSRRDRFNALDNRISELHDLPVNSDGFHEIAISQEVNGFFDQKMNLIKVQYEGKTLSFADLVTLNQHGQIPSEDFYDLMDLQNPVFKEIIRLDFGVDLSTLSLRVQNQFLNFIKDGDKKLIAGVREFVLDVNSDDQKISRMKSFLSMEEDPGMALKIFSLEKKYTDKSEPIFSKYAEIVDAAENVRSYLQENYHGQADSGQTIELIIQNLLHKGKDLLADFADNPREPEEVISALENYRTETLIFASTCRALKQEGQQINLEDFRQYGVDVLPATEIVPEDQQIMMQVSTENWQNQDQDLAEYALDSLQKSFTNPESRFYILRYGGQVLGFKRFDNMENNDLYAGSFNINPQLRRSGIGEAAMRAYLSQEAETHTVHADASPFTPITTRYIGEFGFVGTNIKDMEYKGKTFPLLGMERNDKIIDQYRFVSAPYGEIAKNYRNSEPDQETGTLVILVNQENVLDQMRQSLSSGDLVLTAYRPNPDNPKEYLLAFEPKIKVENPTENVAQALV